MKPLARRLLAAESAYRPIVQQGEEAQYLLAQSDLDTDQQAEATQQVVQAQQALDAIASERETVTTDLMMAVMPWVQCQINRECSHMPAGADPAEIRSQMMMATWRTAEKYDPTCPQSWPTALQQRLRGAWLEAYRSVDFITRRQRALNNQWRMAVEDQVHELRRELTESEKIAVATRIVPATPGAVGKDSDPRHDDWVKAVVQTPAPPLGGDAIEWESLTKVQNICDDPVDMICDLEIADRFVEWLNKIPPRWVPEIRRALATDRPISARARAAIADWLPELAALITHSDLGGSDLPTTESDLHALPVGR